MCLEIMVWLGLLQSAAVDSFILRIGISSISSERFRSPE